MARRVSTGGGASTPKTRTSRLDQIANTRGCTSTISTAPNRTTGQIVAETGPTSSRPTSRTSTPEIADSPASSAIELSTSVVSVMP